MSKKKQVVKLKSYKRRIRWNIGLVLFVFVFLYLIFSVISYMNRDKTQAYEVREGSIQKDNVFTGLILREEHPVFMEQPGYVNYFHEQGAKVRVNDNIYALSSSALDDSFLNTENADTAVTGSDWNRVLMKVQGFNESFQPSQFKASSVLKEDINSILSSSSSETRRVYLNSLIEQGDGSLIDIISTDTDGIITYYTDGFEDMTVDQAIDYLTNKAEYVKREETNNTLLNEGDPVYKLITSENWSVIVKLTDEVYALLKEKMGEKQKLSVETRVPQDDKTIFGVIELIDHDGEYYGVINYSDSMIRYIDQRYISLEIILQDESGLKIPKTSVIEKEFYEVSADYITQGGASSDYGVLCEKIVNDKVMPAEFTRTTIYAEDTKKNVVYLAADAFEPGSILLKPESSETMTLKTTVPLTGVYNINRGYAIFKVVKILCENDTYYIIQSGNKYGLSNYDHIALDGSKLTDSAMIGQ